MCLVARLAEFGHNRPRCFIEQAFVYSYIFLPSHASCRTSSVLGSAYAQGHALGDAGLSFTHVTLSVLQHPSRTVQWASPVTPRNNAQRGGDHEHTCTVGIAHVLFFCAFQGCSLQFFSCLDTSTWLSCDPSSGALFQSIDTHLPLEMVSFFLMSLLLAESSRTL